MCPFMIPCLLLSAGSITRHNKYLNVITIIKSEKFEDTKRVIRNSKSKKDQ